MILRLKSFFLENRTPRQTVAKNTFWVFFGQITSRLIRVGLIVYAARLLGATNYGAFSYALSLAALFTIFADFGINALITRESSKDIRVQNAYFSTGLVIKVVMIIFIAVFVVAFSPLLFKQKIVAELMPLVILIVGFDSLRDFGASLSRAWEKMEIEAFIQIITNVFIVAAGFFALYLSPTAKALSWGYAVGTGIGMISAFYPFRHYLKNIGSFSRKLIRPIIVSSWPLGVLALSGIIMLNTDNIMIGWIKGITDVGYYSAAQRIAQLIFLVPAMIMTAFFPSLAKFSNQKEKISALVEKSSILLLIIAIPLTVGGVMLAYQILNLLFGSEYLSGANSFKIMGLMYVPVFLSTVFGNALFAINREKVLLKYAFLSIVGNFLLNLLLIPVWGIVGSALSSLAVQTIITFFVFLELKKSLRFNIISRIKKILISALIMGIGIYVALIFGINIYLTLIIAILLYLSSLIAFKENILLEIKNILIHK